MVRIFCLMLVLFYIYISPLYIRSGVPLLLHHSEHHLSARCITALYLTIGISYYLTVLITYLETTCSCNLLSVPCFALEVFHTYLHQKPVSVATNFSWMSRVPICDCFLCCIFCRHKIFFQDLTNLKCSFT